MTIPTQIATQTITPSSLVIDTIKLRAPYSYTPIPGRVYGYNSSAQGHYSANLSEKIRVKGRYNLHNAQLRHSARRGELLLEGSVAGFLYGQNVFGNSNPCIAGYRYLMQACRKANLAVSDEQRYRWKTGNFELHRLDMAINLKLQNDSEVGDVLQQIARQLIEQHCETWVMYQSVYWSPKKTEEYGIAFYAKGRQLAQRRHGRNDEILQRLEEECAGTLRIELRLKRPALLDLGLNKGTAWNSSVAREILGRYLKRLPLLDVLSGPNLTDKWQEMSMAQKRTIVAASSPIPLDQLYSASAVSKIKTELRKKGIDLNPPYSQKPAIRLTSIINNSKYLLRTPQWLIDANRAPKRRRRNPLS